MENKNDLSKLPRKDLDKLWDAADEKNGMADGYTQGEIWEEISKRSEIVSQPGSLPEVPKSESLPKKQSRNSHKAPSKMRFVDQQMSNIMGPGWGRRTD